jgi:hypothetical protein
MNREPRNGLDPATRRLPTHHLLKHRGRSLDPSKTHPSYDGPAWRVASPLRNGIQATPINPPSGPPLQRQHRVVVPVPSMVDPAPRGCSAVAAAQRKLDAHAAAPG